MRREKNIEQISYECRDASTVDSSFWRRAQLLQAAALTGMAGINGRRAYQILGISDPEQTQRYQDSHYDPNTEVGRSFRPNQSYRHPHVVRAFDTDELTGRQDKLVGFAYGADNASGNIFERAGKYMLGRDLYWVREVVVAPDYWYGGVGSRLTEKLLEHARPDQAVSAWLMPETIDTMRPRVEALGFTAMHDFVEGEQLGMRAPSAELVLDALRAQAQQRGH